MLLLLKWLWLIVSDRDPVDQSLVGQLVEGFHVLLVQIVDIIDIVVTHHRVRVDASESLTRCFERFIVILWIGIIGKFMSQPNDVSDFVEEGVLEYFSPVWLDKRFVVDKDILDFVGEERTRQRTLIFCRLIVPDEEVGLYLVSGC